MKYLCIILMSALIASCSSKSKRSGHSDTEVTYDIPYVGDYVYLDDIGVLHTNELCPMLQDYDKSKRRRIRSKRMIDTTNFIISDFDNLRYCTYCVDDFAYKILSIISDRNSKRLGVYENNINHLFEIVSDKYSDSGEYEEFIENFKDLNKRRILYDALKRDGFSDLGTWDEFNAKYGVINFTTI